MKLVWRVAPEPTGKYKSFQRRGWPTAFFSTAPVPAAFLECEDDYVPARVREGQHRPITITVLHHNHPESGNSWRRFRLKRTAETLDEAKWIVQQFVEENPTWHPKK